MDMTARVIVVAGDDDRLRVVAAELLAAGAFVAFVATGRTLTEAAASFRADPTDPQVWDRVAPHVEQRLGPVDAVIADPACALLLEQVFAPDLRRRGHGGVVTLAVGAEPADVLRLLSDML